MSTGRSDDLPPLCADCGYRHDPGDRDECELKQLRSAAEGTAPALEEDDDHYPEGGG